MNVNNPFDKLGFTGICRHGDSRNSNYTLSKYWISVSFKEFILYNLQSLTIM